MHKHRLLVLRLVSNYDKLFMGKSESAKTHLFPFFSAFLRAFRYEVLCMKVSYNKLWKMLIDKKMTKTGLRDAVNMSSNTLAKMGKEETVSMDVIMRICKVLECDVGDIMEITSDE